MAFASVNPVSILWKRHGLRCILANEDVLHKLRPKRSEEYALRQPCRTPPQRSMRPEEFARPSTSSQAPPARANWHPVPVMEWPGEWRTLLQTTRKGLFAWTYLDLGRDLAAAKQAGSSDDGGLRRQRGLLMRRMLSDLAHPVGTHTFWPMRIDDRHDEATGIEMFWSGANALGCRGVVIMGSRAAVPLLQNRTVRPLTQLRYRGQLVWIIEDLDRICLNETSYARILTFLRREMQLVLRRERGGKS